jgi:hypothetical protein
VAGVFCVEVWFSVIPLVHVRWTEFADVHCFGYVDSLGPGLSSGRTETVRAVEMIRRVIYPLLELGRVQEEVVCVDMYWSDQFVDQDLRFLVGEKDVPLGLAYNPR